MCLCVCLTVLRCRPTARPLRPSHGAVHRASHVHVLRQASRAGPRGRGTGSRVYNEGAWRGRHRRWAPQLVYRWALDVAVVEPASSGLLRFLQLTRPSRVLCRAVPPVQRAMQQESERRLRQRHRRRSRSAQGSHRPRATMPGHQDSTGSLPLVKQDTRIKHQSWEVRESGGRVGPYTVPHHDASRGDDSRWAVGDSPRSADLPFVASPTASASSPPRGLTNSPGFGVQRHPSTGDTLVQLAVSPTHQPDAPTDEILDPPRSRGQRRASAMTHGSYPEQPGFRGGGPELAQDSSGWDQVVVATQAVKPTLPSLRPPSEPAAVRFVRRATHTPTRQGNSRLTAPLHAILGCVHVPAGKRARLLGTQTATCGHHGRPGHPAAPEMDPVGTVGRLATGNKRRRGAGVSQHPRRRLGLSGTCDCSS